MLTLRSVPSGVTAFGWLSCDSLGLSLLAGLLSQRHPEPRARPADDLPLKVRMAIGVSTLPAVVLRSLGPRDVVLLDRHCFDGSGELWLTLDGGWTLRMREEGGALIVTQSWRKVMETSSDVLTGQDAGIEREAAEDSGDFALPDKDSEQTALFDEVPVTLSFDLGECVVPLGVLRTLAPGEVFPLGRPLAEGCVRVRVNGREIAIGDIVDIDGCLGVQLRKVLLR